MNSCGTGIPVFTRIPPDSCSRQTLSCSGQLKKSPPTSSPTSKLTTLQTPKHAPKHVVYSMQYHLLLQLNLNTKIVRCCCRHLRHSIFVPSPVLPHFLLDIITTVFCLAVAGSSASRLPSVCTGWLSRRILWLHLYLYLSPLRRASCFSCPPAAKHLPLVVSRCRRLSRCHRLLSAGPPPVCLLFPGWLS